MHIVVRSVFQRDTSTHDWCEPNYVVNDVIAEFWNTVSNVFFFLVPPIMMILFRNYSKGIAKNILILWVLLIVVGIGSIYFHSTLSSAGEIMDKFAILWVVMIGYGIFLPDFFMHSASPTLRRRFLFACTAIAFSITCLSIVYPYINSIPIIAIIGTPAFIFFPIHMTRCNDQRLKSLGIHCCIVSIMGVVVWICDRLFCSFWLYISFPYLHSIWHVLILFGSNEAIVICIYSAIKQQNQHAKILLHTWPNDNWRRCGLPYIKLYDEDAKNTVSSKSSNSADVNFITQIVSSNHVPIQIYSNSNAVSKRSTKL